MHHWEGTEFLEDLANQIRHWENYTSEICKRGRQAGKFLSPAVAEYFSGPATHVFSKQDVPCFYLVCLPGLPPGWTCPRPGTVNWEHFNKSFSGSQACGLTWFILQITKLNVFDSTRKASAGKMKCISLFTGVGGLELHTGLFEAEGNIR